MPPSVREQTQRPHTHIPETLTHRQVPGKHLDAYAHPAPRLYRLKPTDAVRRAHAGTHAPLRTEAPGHRELLQTHSGVQTQLPFAATYGCAQPDAAVGHDGKTDTLHTYIQHRNQTTAIVYREIETREGKITRSRSHSERMSEPNFQVFGNIQMFTLCFFICFSSDRSVITVTHLPL